jgi:hypothetical protein
MTSYIRLFHMETHRLSFLAIETLVTLGMLLLFALLPTRYLAFFPNRGLRRFTQKRFRACGASIGLRRNAAIGRRFKVLGFTFADIQPTGWWAHHCKMTTSDVLLKIKAEVGKKGRK